MQFNDAWASGASPFANQNIFYLKHCFKNIEFFFRLM